MTLPRQRILHNLSKLWVAELEKAAPNVAFGRLRKSFRYRVRDDGARATLYSVYYWAAFVDQGRRAIRGKLMRFFVDPRDDPRVAADYPRAVHDRQALHSLMSPQEMRRMRKKGKLIVTFNVKRARAYNFSEKAREQVNSKAPRYMQKFLSDEVDAVLDETRGGSRVRRFSIRIK